MRKNVRKYSLWLYYVLSVAILLAAFLVVTWYVADRFRTFFVDQQRNALEVTARTIILDIEKNGFPLAGMTEICSASKQTDSTLRVTLINADGVVLCDSDANWLQMDNHKKRPEVSKAFYGSTGSVIRFSNTVKASMLYVAVPLDTGDGIWVVRTARPLAAIDELLKEVFQKLIAVTVLLVFAVFLVSLYVYR
ncbi:MAG: hypothetical protein WBP44_17255, partial [Gammaproteobacteria bacterium]